MNFPLLRRLAAATFLLLASAATCAELPGRPPMTRLSPTLDVYPQNFAVTQDTAGVIFVGNSDGVLTYDGVRWELIALPNQDIVRSLSYDPVTKRVYVGGFGLFGYLEPARDGRYRFTDLTPQFAASLEGRALADIWSIYVTPDAVFFAAVKDLFRYSPESGKTGHWFHEGRFGAGLWKDGSFLIQWRGEGIKRLRGDRFELIAGTETLTEQLYFLVDRPDGRILATGVSGDWLLWGGDGITSFPADPALGPSSTYPSLRANPDGSMILGTADGQIVFVEPDGTRARAVRIGHDWVGGLHRTADGTVLATTDGATVVAVPWPPSWFLIDAGDGLHGTIHAIRQAGDELYALGSSGVFRIDPAATNTDRAQRLDWTPFEAWDLLDAGDDRLLAGSYQLFRVDRDGRSKAISQRDLYPRSFHPSSFDPDTIWAATEKGLARVARGPEGWSVAADLSSIDTLVTSLIEVSRTELWVGTYGLGALRVTLSPELDEIVAQDTFDELGLSPAVRPSVILREIQAGRYALTADGVYRWTGNEWRSDDLFGLVGILDSGEEIDLRESPDGDLWAFSYRHIYRRSPGEDWLDTYVQAVSTGPFGGIAFTDHGPLFGALAALLRYAGDHDEQTRVQPVVRLRDVRHRAPGEDDRYLVLNDGQPATFAAGHDQFTFRFALQDLRNPEAVRFSGRLRGFEENWSEWSRTAEYTYGSLEPGAYRFEVRGRDSTGQISTAPAFEFAVVPPWHQRTGPRLAALLGLFLFGGIVAAVAMRIRNRQLRRQNRMLEQLVRDRTRALSDANRQLKDLADSDGLTGLANRRRFDAALADLWNLRPLALLMLDVDHFKAYNDSNGHLAGDDLLRSVASILHSEAGRYGATAARYGGEEFTVILPDCNREEAAEIAEGLRRQIETKTQATISIGVAGAVDEDRQPADLVERADRALYRAKELGRNQVVLLSRAED